MTFKSLDELVAKTVPNDIYFNRELKLSEPLSKKKVFFNFF
jgi:hypothetical protein